MCPGFVETEVQDDWLSDPKTKSVIEALHLTRIGQPEDTIARFILYLVEDDFLIGSIYAVDGGGGLTGVQIRVSNYETLEEGS